MAEGKISRGNMDALREERAVARVQALFREPSPEMLEDMTTLAVAFHRVGVEKNKAVAAAGVLSLFIVSYVVVRKEIREEQTPYPRKG